MSTCALEASRTSGVPSDGFRPPTGYRDDCVWVRRVFCGKGAVESPPADMEAVRQPSTEVPTAPGTLDTPLQGTAREPEEDADANWQPSCGCAIVTAQCVGADSYGLSGWIVGTNGSGARGSPVTQGVVRSHALGGGQELMSIRIVLRLPASATVRPSPR